MQQRFILAQEFIHLVRQQLPEPLDSCPEQSKNSTIKAFQSFAKELKEDYDAVEKRSHVRDQQWTRRGSKQSSQSVEASDVWASRSVLTGEKIDFNQLSKAESLAGRIFRITKSDIAGEILLNI